MKYGTTHIIYYQGKNKLHEILTFEQKLQVKWVHQLKKHINLESSKYELCRSRIGFFQPVGDGKNK